VSLYTFGHTQGGNPFANIFTSSYQDSPFLLSGSEDFEGFEGQTTETAS